MKNSPYALILAGGSGERFWPLSRRARPKQLLRLVSEKTLLEETIDRLDGLVPHERILILTNVAPEAAVRALLPDFPADTIVADAANRAPPAALPPHTGWCARREGVPRRAAGRGGKRGMFGAKDARGRRGGRSASIAGQSKQHDVAETIASSVMALVTFPERKVTSLAAASGTQNNLARK